MSTADRDGDRTLAEVPRPPPRRRRKSHDSSSVGLESVSRLPDTERNTSSSSSSMLSWYDMNQTTTPATTPTTGSWIDMEQPDNDKNWINHSNADDQLMSPSTCDMTKNNTLYQNSFWIRTAVPERVQSSETLPKCNDPLCQFSNDDAIDLSKCTSNNCEINKEEKYNSDSDDVDDDNYILAAWKKKKNGDIHCPVACMNNQHYQPSSSYYVGTTVSKRLLQPSICDVGNQPKSNDEICGLHKLHKQLSSDDEEKDDNDDDYDIFASRKERNEDFCQRVANNGCCPNEAANNQRGDDDQQNRKCRLDMSVCTAAQHDDGSPTTSSTPTSGIIDKCSTDDVSKPSGNVKRKGIFWLQHCSDILSFSFKVFYCTTFNIK